MKAPGPPRHKAQTERELAHTFDLGNDAIVNQSAGSAPM
jgi:hypothetical protein